MRETQEKTVSWMFLSEVNKKPIWKNKSVFFVALVILFDDED